MNIFFPREVSHSFNQRIWIPMKTKKNHRRSFEIDIHTVYRINWVWFSVRTSFTICKNGMGYQSMCLTEIVIARVNEFILLDDSTVGRLQFRLHYRYILLGCSENLKTKKKHVVCKKYIVKVRHFSLYFMCDWAIWGEYLKNSLSADSSVPAKWLLIKEI